LKPAQKIEINAVLRIEIDHDDERQHIEKEGQKAVRHFIEQLQMGQPLLFSQLTGEIVQLKGIKDLSDFKITSSENENKTYTPQSDKRSIEATYSQRLVPARIIVVSETKDLPVYIQVQVIFPDQTTRDGIKIAKQIPQLFNHLDEITDNMTAQLEDFFNQLNKAPTPPAPYFSAEKQFEWAIALSESSQNELSLYIQNRLKQVAKAAESLKTKLTASLDQQIRAIFVKVIKEYSKGADTLLKTELEHKLTETLTQKPAGDDELRERLKQTVHEKLAAFLDEEMLHFQDNELTGIIEMGLNEAYSQKSSDNKRQREYELTISQREYEFALRRDTEKWKLNPNKKQTQTSYEETLVSLRTEQQQKQAQLIQTVETHQRQLDANWKGGLKTLKTLTEKLKATLKTALAEMILNEKTLNEIVKETGQLSAYRFHLTMVEAAFQKEILREVSKIKPSFVEKPVVDLDRVFIYSDRLELTGKIGLFLSLTATVEEKEQTKNTLRQSIEDYLTLLAPEENVDLMEIKRIATKHEKVQRVDFKSENCHLVVGDTPVDDRKVGDSLRIESFEKVFLSEEFVILV
jgi:hypothetical protein